MHINGCDSFSSHKKGYPVEQMEAALKDSQNEGYSYSIPHFTGTQNNLVALKLKLLTVKKR